MNVLKLSSFQDNVKFTSGFHRIHMKGRKTPETETTNESLSPEVCQKEASMAAIARQNGVNIPRYLGSVYGIKYDIKGDKADYKSNPITEKHLTNLFNNLLKLDEAGILHNDLDKNHVFYSKNGNVEFDCLRYSQEFGYNEDTGRFTVFENGEPKLGKNNEMAVLDFPKFMMPSNQDGYIYAGLGEYVSSIDNERKKKDFVKLYLQKSADYHKTRMENLAKMGVNKNNDMLVCEKVKSEMLKNPTDDMVNLEIMKFEFQAKRRKAFTDWDEGNGNGSNHSIDSKRRIKAVYGFLDSLELANEFTKRARELSETACMFEKDRLMQYFNYEDMYGLYWVNTLADRTKGLALRNFTDDKMGITVSKQDIKSLEESFNSISHTCLSEKSDAIEKCTSYYTSLLNN